MVKQEEQERSLSRVSAAGTPRRKSLTKPNLPADTYIKPVQEEHGTAEDEVAHEPVSLWQACARTVRDVEMREQEAFEELEIALSEADAFEEHLFQANPTRRSNIARNKGCLDLDAMWFRARPRVRFEKHL